MRTTRRACEVTRVACRPDGYENYLRCYAFWLDHRRPLAGSEDDDGAFVCPRRIVTKVDDRRTVVHPNAGDEAGGSHGTCWTNLVTASAADFATYWTEAVLASAEPAAPVDDTRRLLGRLTDRLRDALAAEPFRAGAGYEVGAALFGSHLTSPATIGATVACLIRLPQSLALDVPSASERLPSLVGAVVTGYTAALRACTIEELELRQEPRQAGRRPADPAGPARRRGDGRGAREDGTRLRAVF